MKYSVVFTLLLGVVLDSFGQNLYEKSMSKFQNASVLSCRMDGRVDAYFSKKNYSKRSLWFYKSDIGYYSKDDKNNIAFANEKFTVRLNTSERKIYIYASDKSNVEAEKMFSTSSIANAAKKLEQLQISKENKVELALVDSVFPLNNGKKLWFVIDKKNENILHYFAIDHQRKIEGRIDYPIYSAKYSEYDFETNYNHLLDHSWLFTVVKGEFVLNSEYQDYTLINNTL
jgi:hypothetical protein